MNDKEIKLAALNEIKGKRKEIIATFAGDQFPKVECPVSIYMAGSPGAGKTEFSTRFIELFETGAIVQYFEADSNVISSKIVRIDPDEIRKLISYYNGANAYLFQAAVSNGVAKLLDHCHEKINHTCLMGHCRN